MIFNLAISIPPQLNLMLNSEEGGDISGFMPNGKSESIPSVKIT